MQDIKITIIDYQLGNLFSVQHACKYFGYESIISSAKDDIEDADALILPGVGAFGDAMDNMNRLDLVLPLIDAVNQNKPLLGICLGMQLLFTESEEFGNHKGLGLIDGTIKKFNFNGVLNIKVPQIGWNSIYIDQAGKWENTPLKNTEQNDFMYFVHSFYCDPQDEHDILTHTNYEDFEYCSSIHKDNIFATQFHPEKSADKGLLIYKNWLTRIKK